MAAENYYYQMLNREEQQCYHMMKSGIQSMQAAFPIPLLDGKRLADIFFLLRLDHPELFWAESFRYRYMNGADHGEMIPEYLFQKNKIQDQQNAMNSRIRKLTGQMKGMKPEEQLLYIHDLICTTVRYDKLKKGYSHEIIGPLGQGVGVCEGIAKTVKILCDQAGIWCIIAVSEADPEKGIKYRHAWNIVKISGQTYHLDATFDNSLYPTGTPRYDYYMIGDDQLYRDHEPVIWKVPACPDHKHFYYKEKKMSFTTTDEVRKRCAQAVKKRKPFIFHWRGGYLTKDVLTELLAIMQQEAAEKGQYARVSLNWPQAVLYTVFEDQEPEIEMVWEEANEGEKLESETDSSKI